METDLLDEGKIPYSNITTSDENGAVDATASINLRNVQEGNRFQKALTSWRGVDLTNLLPKFDSTASDIVAFQRESLVQRKELAQKTKDFRKLDDTAKLREYKGLLKAYQAFIDLLTNNSKSTTSAFLQLYTSISEAPDPYPLLEASLDALLLSEDTLPKINAENERLQKAVNNLSGQLERAESRLNDERETRKTLETSWESKVQDIEASWAAVLDEKRDNWGSRERNLEEKVETQERLLRELKASFEVSQRLDRTEDKIVPSSLESGTEIVMMSSELERTNARLADVEARNEQLRLNLAQATSQAKHPDITIEDDPTFLRIQSENSNLLRKLDAFKFERDVEARKMEEKLRSMEKALGVLTSDNQKLQRDAVKYGDYFDIKRELEVFKSIEFATVDGDEENGVENEDPVSKESASACTDNPETLERLLLHRNKRLGNDLTLLRVARSELQDRLGIVEKDLAVVTGELEESRSLVATLEDDLLRVQQDQGSNFQSSTMSAVGTYASRLPQSWYGARKGRASPTSSILSGMDPSLAVSGESGGHGSGILPMVTAQRDRFRQRNAQLEEEVSRTYTTVSSLRQEIASLQKDNLSLYERTRYMSTYNRAQPTSSSSSYSANPNSSTIHVSSASDAPSGVSLDKYRSAYEAHISPFAAFRGRESARALKRMNLPERIIFSITRLVLANRSSRNLFAIYCLALHLLVFGMLYWVGTADIEMHASNLGEAGKLSTVGNNEMHTEWHQEGFHERI